MFCESRSRELAFLLNWCEHVLTLHFLSVVVYEMLQVWACLEFPASKGALKVVYTGGVKTERGFPGLSVLRKNNKMEVLSPEKWKYYPRKIKIKKGKIGPALERSPAISADVFSGNSTSKMLLTFFSGNSTSKMRLPFFSGNSTSKMRLTFFSGNSTSKMRLTFFSRNSTSKMRLTFRLAATFGLEATFGLSI